MLYNPHNCRLFFNNTPKEIHTTSEFNGLVFLFNPLL